MTQSKDASRYLLQYLVYVRRASTLLVNERRLLKMIDGRGGRLNLLLSRFRMPPLLPRFFLLSVLISSAGTISRIVRSWLAVVCRVNFDRNSNRVSRVVTNRPGVFQRFHFVATQVHYLKLHRWMRSPKCDNPQNR